jgi:hypothetical protein
VKGTHLVRVTKTQGGFPLPMKGVHVETLRLEEPLEIRADAEVLYLCLDGEVVLDFGLEFAHLRSLESFTVRGAHKLSPVGTAIVLRLEEARGRD